MLLPIKIQTTIILISLFLGLASGFLMHRSDFCLAGIFRDLFLFRSSPLLPSLLLLVGCSMLLFEGARLAGLISPAVLYPPPSVTHLLGGALFGIGMVLAGGCVVGTLYKLGAGNLVSAYAFIGLIAGSTLYAEFHPLWLELGKLTTYHAAVSLPQLLGLPPTSLVLATAAILGFFLARWQIRGQIVRPNQVEGYLQPRSAALLLALIGALSFGLTGMPLGITTSYAKVGAYFEQLAFPEHVAALSYFQGQGFEYFSPLASQVLRAGAGPFWDGLALVQLPLIAGIVLGAGLSARLLGKFQARFAIPRIQLFSALIGGILMGLAARMAPSCNVWHLLGGLPLLSLTSILFALGLLPGAWLGTWILTRYVLPDTTG